MCCVMGYTGHDLSAAKFKEYLLRTVMRGPDDQRVVEGPFGLMGFGRLAIMGLTPEGRFVEFTLPLPDGDELRYRFAGKPLQLVEKSCRGFWKRRWRVRYYDWKRTGGRWSVGNAVLDDDASGCRIVVRTRTVTPEGGKIE